MEFWPFSTPSWCQTLEGVDRLMLEKVNKSIEKLISGKTDLCTMHFWLPKRVHMGLTNISFLSVAITLSPDQSALSLIFRSSTSGLVPKVLLSWCLGNISWHRWLEKYNCCSKVENLLSYHPLCWFWKIRNLCLVSFKKLLFLFVCLLVDLEGTREQSSQHWSAWRAQGDNNTVEIKNCKKTS